MQLSPLGRRLTYVITFEFLAIALGTLLLTSISDGGVHGSLPIAVMSSVVAVIWNFVYNTGFERWERRRRLTRRSLRLRIGHAAGFEVGLVAILIPIFMWWYQVGPIEALRLEVALLAFFLVFTFLFTWAFDRIVPKPKAV